MFPVRIFSKDGKLVRVVSSKQLAERSLRTLTNMFAPHPRSSKFSRRKKKKKKAAWRAYCCKNCGVRVKSKVAKACFCSLYCAGYWGKYVVNGDRKAFCAGGLNDLPVIKKRLAAVVASDRIFIKGKYKPIKRSDV